MAKEKRDSADRAESLLKLSALIAPSTNTTVPKKDLSPDDRGEYKEPVVFSLDKPTFRSDKPLFMKKGGSVRGNGCCMKAKKCKIR